MDEDVFNMSLRKFLKKVGVTSQREIEKAVREALEGGGLDAGQPLRAKVTVEIEAVGLAEVIDGKIELS